jgi:hypothetical protein
MQRGVATTLFVLAGGGLVASVLAILPLGLDLLVFLLLAAVFTLPGWPIAHWFAGSDADRLTRAILALPLGYFSGAITYAALRLAGISSPAVILAVCIGLTALLWRAFRRPQPGIVALNRLGTADRIAVAVLWLAALAVVGPVFARVGEVTPAGLAYRAYFNADLFVHMSVVAELAKGSSPTFNPFFPIEPLPYYWTYFTLPGLFSQVRPALPVDPAIMLTDTGMALMFISAGFLAVRNFGTSASAAAIAWVTVLLASSYEGAFYIWDQVSRGRPVADFRTFNIDAVTRWVWNLPGVDGFQRAMWWTPQHLMALTLALILLITMIRARKTDSLRPAIVEGLLLGGILAISSFNGLLILGSYALAQVTMLAFDRGRGMRQWLIARSTAAVIVVVFLGLTLGLGMVQRIPNAFIFGWNRFFLRGPWAFILLSFGPALFFAPIGVKAALNVSRRLVIMVGAVFLVITVVFLQVDLRGHENTQVTFRTGHLLFVLLAILLAFAIDAARRWSKAASIAFSMVLFLAIAAAVPTVALDWYNARDISNVAMNPGRFPWTVHISPDDNAAANWIHATLPADATVQTDALPRERYTWAFITAFARRRMAVGNGLFTLNPDRYTPAMTAVHEAFSASTAVAAHASLVNLGVDYLYVGDLERRVNGDHVEKFSQNPRLFEPVYWHGTVAIYKVIK